MTNLDHPTKKLGKRPRNADRRAIPFGDHLRATPTHPIAVDDARGFVFAMDLNDKVGDCVVAAWDHFRQVVTGLLTGSAKTFTDAEIVAFYRTQNPQFNLNGDPNVDGPGSPADGGMDIQVFLEWLQENGYILGFALVDHTNAAEVEAALYLDLALIAGYRMQQAQQDQKVFDYVPGSPQWGGHSMAKVSYTATEIGEATWGEVVEATLAFLQHCCEEVWFVILPEHRAHPDFRTGFDLNSYAKAFEDITGKPFPGGPTPTPTPTPTPVPADQMLATWVASKHGQRWLHGRHVGLNAEAALQVATWVTAQDG